MVFGRLKSFDEPMHVMRELKRTISQPMVAEQDLQRVLRLILRIGLVV